MMKLTLSLLAAMVLSLTACTQTKSPEHSTKSTLTVQEFNEALKNDDVLLVDVRTPQEYSSGHIPGSINVDWTGNDYEAQFAELDTTKHLLLYCAIGGRSDQAREYLEGKGYRVQDLEDGIKAWKEAGMPVEK
jgi:rhodanese-related sulfurtransferase